MTERRARIWTGIDAGKGHHWAAAVDESGFQIWSEKINDAAILEAIAEALAMADAVEWAIDLTGTASALLLALPASHGQKPVHVPGRTVHRMAGAYRGEAKTDARDAFVIAETSRLRRDPTAVDVPAQLVADPAPLVAHRNRPGRRPGPHGQPAPRRADRPFPAPERAFDWSNNMGAPRLLTYRQTPAGIRRVGRARLESWLRKPGVRSPDKVTVFYTSAQTSTIKDGPNRAFDLKKRAEGCSHVQALIALARRRVNALWALLRDEREFTPAQPVTQTA